MGDIEDITYGIMPVSEEFSDCLYDSDFVGWNPAVSRSEAERRLVNYLKEYGEYYLPEHLEYIKRNFHNYISLRGANTILAQIYSYLGIFREENDTYLGYAKKLEEYFDLDRDILDIASGDYPPFALFIALRQLQLGCGTVTVMDPALVCEHKIPAPNMKVYRKSYTSFTPVDGYSLITSTLPCGLTEKLLRRFIGGDKDLFIALCACYNHNEIYPGLSKKNYIRTYEIALDYAQSLFEKRGRGELIIDKLDSNYNASQPILIYKAN